MKPLLMCFISHSRIFVLHRFTNIEQSFIHERYSKLIAQCSGILAFHISQGYLQYRALLPLHILTLVG